MIMFEKVECFGRTLTSESEVNETRNLLSRILKTRISNNFAFVSCGCEKWSHWGKNVRTFNPSGWKENAQEHIWIL